MTSAIALRLAVTLVVTALTFLGGFPTLGHAALFINEIMADPASDWDGDGAYQYRDDEWVEIINTGPEAVDLAGHGLRDAASTTPAPAAGRHPGPRPGVGAVRQRCRGLAAIQRGHGGGFLPEQRG